ncbi:hypothetical protein T03_16924 [Trichinella britovi]|uniref:Uncharacterized protein n=1 Tax=Trichinella britovi TaxID=45882 RepID=A0A0V1C9M2_TRIBR|nr:hypothetical protein T03_16924 [Trichinella britovi]
MKIRHCEKEECIYTREQAQRFSTISTRSTSTSSTRSTCSTRVNWHVLVRVIVAVLVVYTVKITVCDSSSVSLIHCEDNCA